MRPPIVFAALAATLQAGCTAMKPGLGFDEVREQVSARTGMHVRWTTGSNGDQEIGAAVRRLLDRELSADDAVQVALLNNHELRAVYEELHLAQADLVQAGLLNNPVFSGEVRFGLDDPGTSISFDVAQEFVSLLSMPLRKGRAQAQFEAAKLRVTASVLDMTARVRSAYYAYVAAEQTTEMRRSVVHATGASYELARRVRAAGNSTELDLAVQQDMHEQAKLDLALAEGNVIVARERLTALMGLWGDQTRWRASPRLPPVPADDVADLVKSIERRTVENSLELAIARRDIETAARSLGIVRPISWLTEGSAGVAAEREEGDWSLGPALSVPVPFFDQGQASVGRAEAELRQASELYHARAVQLRSRARAAAAVFASAHARVRYYEAVLLPLRGKIVEQTQLQYNAMQIPAFQLLQARREQIEAGAEYIETLHDYWVARAELELVLGRRLAPSESPVSTPGDQQGS